MESKMGVQKISEVTISQPVMNACEALQANPVIQKALDDIRKDDHWALEEMITITQIPAPPFKEEKRAAYLRKRFQDLGLSDVSQDSEGNVIAVRKGTNPQGPVFVVSAHIDTVFPEGTDVTVKEKDGVYHAPGMGDNVRGLVTMLALVKALNENKIQTVGDLVFVGTVGEEGEGDLRGCKAFFKENTHVAGFISFDNGDMESIVSRSTGSHRYEVIFSGPGGHSFIEFGKVPSAIHAMGRAISKIADVQVPDNPKTTFTVGTIEGGTTVNSIAAHAVMGLDMRSNDDAQLVALEEQIMALIHEAVNEENNRWNVAAKISVDFKPIGNRPAGLMADDCIIVQACMATLNALGIKGELSASSTDSNVPMSLGIPALTVGKGGKGGKIHSLDEWYKHENAWLGAQNGLLLALSLAGCEQVCEPLLSAR